MAAYVEFHRVTWTVQDAAMGLRATPGIACTAESLSGAMLLRHAQSACTRVATDSDSNPPHPLSD
jgi:hypothetical protein